MVVATFTNLGSWWFDFWVRQLFGNPYLAYVVTGIIFGIIGLIGRMSYLLLYSLLILYFIAFGVGLVGEGIYFLLLLGSFIYMLVNVIRAFRE